MPKSCAIKESITTSRTGINQDKKYSNRAHETAHETTSWSFRKFLFICLCLNQMDALHIARCTHWATSYKEGGVRERASTRGGYSITNSLAPLPRMAVLLSTNWPLDQHNLRDSKLIISVSKVSVLYIFLIFKWTQTKSELWFGTINLMLESAKQFAWLNLKAIIINLINYSYL